MTTITFEEYIADYDQYWKEASNGKWFRVISNANPDTLRGFDIFYAPLLGKAIECSFDKLNPPTKLYSLDGYKVFVMYKPGESDQLVTYGRSFEHEGKPVQYVGVTNGLGGIKHLQNQGYRFKSMSIV